MLNLKPCLANVHMSCKNVPRMTLLCNHRLPVYHVLLHVCICTYVMLYASGFALKGFNEALCKCLSICVIYIYIYINIYIYIIYIYVCMYVYVYMCVCVHIKCMYID